jgi:hypothetical protein
MVGGSQPKSRKWPSKSDSWQSEVLVIRK